MASTIAAFDCNFLDSQGAKGSLTGVTAYMRRSPFTTDFDDVTIDASSQFPATALADAVGTEIRIRIQDDGFGRAGWISRLTE
jgi:hypothetical protein